MDWAPLVATCNGAVWVSSGTERAVSRIDPSSMRVTARIRGFGHVDSLLVGACGYGKVWIQQNANGAGVLYRVDPATLKVQKVYHLKSAAAEWVAVGFGSIWTSSDNSGTGTTERLSE